MWYAWYKSKNKKVIWSLKAMAHCPFEKLDKEEKNNYSVIGALEDNPRILGNSVEGVLS